MNRGLVVIFSLAAALLINRPIARASEPTGTVREFCGMESKVRIGMQFMQWDCQPIQASNISEIESEVQKTHAKDGSGSYRSYYSDQPHRSMWYFNDDYAIHYRAMFNDDEYQCMGVTTYCTASADVCAAVEMKAATDLPPPLMPDTSAPAPHCAVD